MSSRPIPSDGDVLASFSSAMGALGFFPPSIELNQHDFVRFDAPGDKAGKKNGFYKVKTGQYPVGWFGDWKTGEQHQWEFYEKGQLSSKEWKKVQDEHRRLKAEAQVEREALWAERAEDARAIWDKASPDVEGHPYLVRKGIDTAKGLRLHTAGDGTLLVLVPMWRFDMNGQPKLWNLQYIGPDGEKRFMKGARVDGCFFSLRGSAEHNIIVETEGVATGFTIWRATGLSVVVAFNSGNLVKVARELQLWRPLTDVLVAGDDDVEAPADWAEKGRGKAWENAGAKAAPKAAAAAEGRWVLPKFAQGASRARTDFNDLERVESLDVVNKQIWGALGAGTIEPDVGEEGGDRVEARPATDAIDESWRSQLPRTASGMLDGGNVDGVALFIRHHRLLQGRLAFNQFTLTTEVDGAPMQKHHIATFRKVMHHDKYKARKEDVADEMEAEARRNQYDPLNEYLGSLEWDGSLRLDNWLVTHLGCKPTHYIRGIGPRILIGAVARARKPGCKLDTMPVLEGPQGIGKSTAIRYLFGDQFFIDDLSDFTSKDTFQLIQGAWVCEVAELSAMAKAEVNDVKKFLSKAADKFRPPYERAPIQVPRRTIFFGSVNPELGSGYLKDSTGARRFWPIECGKIDLKAVLRDRDQLFAEAVSRYNSGRRWYLDDPELIRLAEGEQGERREVDPWEETVQDYLIGKTTCTIADVLANALRLPVERRDTRASRRVGAVLKALEWTDDVQRVGGKPMRVFSNPFNDGDTRRASND